jgi:hypothetical protein
MIVCILAKALQWIFRGLHHAFVSIAYILIPQRPYLCLHDHEIDGKTQHPPLDDLVAEILGIMEMSKRLECLLKAL